MKVAIPVVIAAAFLLLRLSEKGKLKGDALTALISTGALAVGIMAISLSSEMNIDIYNYMFGSILALTKSDMILSVCLAAVVIPVFVLLYNSFCRDPSNPDICPRHRNKGRDFRHGHPRFLQPLR